MKTSRLAAATAVLSFGLGTAALAADMSRPPPLAAAPVMVAPPTWTGFYLGGSVGGRWTNVDENTVSIGGAPPVGFAPPAASYNDATFRGGVYGGYNMQVSPSWVVGIEGDWAWGDSTKTLAQLPGSFAINPGDTSSFHQKSDAGVRGRIGYLVSPNMMLFVTGGAAWQQFDASAACSTATCGAALAQTNNFTKTGWTIGGGAEWMFTQNWLVRAEYRYSDFGSTTLNYFSGANATVINGSLTTNTALLGLAYKF
jgi:outer membrane immunogenic protein